MVRRREGGVPSGRSTGRGSGSSYTSIVVIPLGTWAVGSAQHWFSRNFEEYLSAVVSVPSPARVCEGGQGWVFDKDPQQLPGLPMNGGDIEAWA